MKRIVLACLALVIAQLVYAQNSAKKFSLVITNANVVDVINGKIIKNQLLAISGDTIKAVDDTKMAAKYKADRYLDAMGKYVMPGLWDMHIHLRGGDSAIGANKNLFPLFLAYGVTTVRECGGDMTPSVMTWRKQVANGELAGPRIFTAGPKLDGPGGTWAGSIPVVTPEQVTAALDSLQKIHVDFVKIYDSKISGDAYLEIIRQAKKRGMKVTGHMPFTVELKEAASLGMDGSEHLYYVFKACSSKEDSITEEIRKSEHTAHPIGLFGALPSLFNTFDSVKAAQLFKYLAQKNFSITPTLFISKTLSGIKETDHTNDSLLAYIDPRIQATYAGRVRGARRQSDEQTRFTQRYQALCASLVPKMYAAGVNIVAGSDCGASNSYVYPGSSIHEEIKLLVASGLTPAQSLKTATANGSKFFGVESFFGSLQKGKCSDMVILDQNPIADINAIDQISSVVSHGKLYSKSDLNALLAAIKH
ncbi:MAG: amidohydrolase family protein [Bacteroidetes bacterium]|nr:amidohydrolase family protein [Bacteroidota bacterium]